MNAAQLILGFPQQASYDAASFMVTPSNQEAYQWVMQNVSWPSYGVVLIGPPGCGKTHLAHIFAAKTGAVFIDRQITESVLHSLIQNVPALIIDDVHTLLSHQNLLFHILNIVREEGKQILLTSQDPFDETNVPLKDLLSRVRALPTVSIQAPDDVLFQAVMVKRFADLQLKVDDRIIQYLLIRSERSFTALHHLIDRIYQASLACKHKPTLALVRGLVE